MTNKKIELVEVGPRDGLQNEPEILSSSMKVEMIHRLIECGCKRLEVASFVHPKVVPQMAGAEEVISQLPDLKNVTYIGLTLNKKGVIRALDTKMAGARGVDQVGCVVVASDTFGQKNQGQTIAEGIAENRDMIRFAKAEGLRAQVTISAAFGCPFEGKVLPDTILSIAEELAVEEPEEIALADTIGVGTPSEVSELFGRLSDLLKDKIPMRAHFHNTYGTGIANAWAAYQVGVLTFDASIGGLGGCPFAPNATGNIATEDLIYMLERSGIQTGVDLKASIATNRWLTEKLGRQLPSMVARAA